MKEENEELKEALFDYSNELEKNQNRNFLLKIENNAEFKKNAYESISEIVFYFSLIVAYSHSENEEEKKVFFDNFKKTKKTIINKTKKDFKEINEMKIYFLENREEIEEFNILENIKKEIFTKEIIDTIKSIKQ